VTDGPELTGGCLCGAVRFVISEPLGEAGYCHCTRCRRRTGTAASVQARVAPGSLRIAAGTERVRAYRPPGGFEKLFCALCGSSLFSRNPDRHDEMSVRLGALDEDPGVRPAYRQFVADAAHWEPIPDDGLPRYAGSRHA
jgi:hypothetical protein